MHTLFGHTRVMTVRRMAHELQDSAVARNGIQIACRAAIPGTNRGHDARVCYVEPVRQTVALFRSIMVCVITITWNT